jgi:hypothetical protein
MNASIIFFMTWIVAFSATFDTAQVAHKYNIWILRHCDKPQNNDNPCCSKNGVIRSQYWNNYFNQYLNTNSAIKIYTSSFRKSCTICVPNTKYIARRYCEKSQRMLETTLYIYKSMLFNNVHINTEYCVGDEKYLAQNILSNVLYTDIIIVWEHIKISKIIEYLGFNMNEWKHDIYDMVIRINKNIIEFDRYDYISNLTTKGLTINNSIISSRDTSVAAMSIKDVIGKICIVLCIVSCIVLCIFIVLLAGGYRVIICNKKNDYDQIL